MLNVALRLAKEPDVEPLREIHRAAMRRHVEKTWGWDEEWQKTFFREHFPFGQRQVVEYGGETAGMLDVIRHDDHIELANIMIAPKFHRNGIGSSLIRQLQNEARNVGVPIRLQVLKVNLDAQRLYERLGFERFGETESHYLMRWAAERSRARPAPGGAISTRDSG